MKSSISIISLGLALLSFNATAQSQATATLSASVETNCEILSADDSHADMGSSLMTTTQGTVDILCNKDLPFSITASTDSSGRIALPAVSGAPDTYLVVAVKDPDGVPFFGGRSYQSTGTGFVQTLSPSYEFNPDGGRPPAGSFEGTITYTLTSTEY